MWLCKTGVDFPQNISPVWHHPPSPASVTTPPHSEDWQQGDRCEGKGTDGASLGLWVQGFNIPSECRASISQALVLFLFFKKAENRPQPFKPLAFDMEYLKEFYPWYVKMEAIPMCFWKKKKIKNLSVKITRQIVQVLWGSLPTVTLVPLLSNNGMLEQEGKNPTTHLCPEALDRMFALPGIFWLTLFTWHPFKELSGEVALAPKET